MWYFKNFKDPLYSIVWLCRPLPPFNMVRGRRKGSGDFSTNDQFRAPDSGANHPLQIFTANACILRLKEIDTFKPERGRLIKSNLFHYHAIQAPSETDIAYKLQSEGPLLDNRLQDYPSVHNWA